MPTPFCHCVLSAATPLFDQFMAWAHIHCPTMALAGALALRAIVSDLDVAATLLAQYDEEAWTLIAPNPSSSFFHIDDAQEGTQCAPHSEEEAEEAELGFRKHCLALRDEAYERLELEQSGITLGMSGKDA
jgi:hypothetical protein